MGILLCLASFTIILRFTYVVVLIESSVLFIAECVPLEDRPQLAHSPADGQLDCSNILTIKNKAAIDVCI